MRKFIRKHQKKFLAFVMIVLMISFAASSGNRTSNKHNDMPIGHIGKTVIYGTELQEARQEWNALKENMVKVSTDRETGEPIVHSIAEIVFPRDVMRSDKAPELFMLLRHEAREAGVRANADDVESIFTNYYQRPTGADESYDDLARDAIVDLSMIAANFQRLANNMKVSAPERDHYLAQALQKIQLNVVEVNRSDFITKVASPTTQQTEEQFKKYADVTPGNADEKNPFGFGYRLPDGVKLQYLVIKKTGAEQAVEATASAYDWDVKARLYYRQHKDEFIPPAPTTMAMGPTSQPSVPPYSEVAAAVLDKLRKPLVDKLMFDVQGKIIAAMQSDWRAYSQNPGSAAASYPSYAYLDKLAGQIQSQFGIKVEVNEMARDFLSEDQLAALPGIGRAGSGQTGFAPYAMQLATAYLAKGGKDAPPAIADLIRPAAPLQDLIDNIYIFRLTDARPSQPASSLLAVTAKVDADLINQSAYRMAEDVAGPLMTATRKTSLITAASALGKIISIMPPFTNPFGRGRANLGKDISLSAAGEEDFVRQGYGLLSQYDPDKNPHPVALISIPQDGKIYVAQLGRVDAQWNRDNFYLYQLGGSGALHQLEVSKLRNGWLNFDAVAARLEYKPETNAKDSSS